MPSQNSAKEHHRQQVAKLLFTTLSKRSAAVTSELIDQTAELAALYPELAKRISKHMNIALNHTQRLPHEVTALYLQATAEPPEEVIEDKESDIIEGQWVVTGITGEETKGEGNE